MERQPSGTSVTARWNPCLAPICFAALLLSLALPTTGLAQLNQTLHQVDIATNDAFFVRGVKLVFPDEWWDRGAPVSGSWPGRQLDERGVVG